VTRFLAGFAVASVVWGGLGAYLVVELGYGPPPTLEEEEAAVAVADAPTPEAPDAPRRGRRRRGGAGASADSSATGSERAPTGDAVTGDDLGEGELRMIDGAGSGGEEQLSGAEIDHAFDGVMGRVRRCFVLAEGDTTPTGRLVFGLRIAGTGRVSAVNLSGPAALTSGDCGECLREAGRSMSFPSFDGPDMVVRYPITLE
jgi:hypothetical protein